MTCRRVSKSRTSSPSRCALLLLSFHIATRCLCHAACPRSTYGNLPWMLTWAMLSDLQLGCASPEAKMACGRASSALASSLHHYVHPQSVRGKFRVQLLPRPTFRLQKRVFLPGSAAAVRVNYEVPVLEALDRHRSEPVPARLWLRCNICKATHSASRTAQLPDACLSVLRPDLCKAYTR